MDLSKARRVVDAGDHFLVDHEGTGYLPAYKDTLSPEDSAQLLAMCGGGNVPRMADGGDVASVDPGQSLAPDPHPSASPAIVPEEQAPQQPTARTQISPDGHVTVDQFTTGPVAIGPRPTGGIPIGPRPTGIPGTSGMGVEEDAAAQLGGTFAAPTRIERAATDAAALQSQRSAMGTSEADALAAGLSQQGAPPTPPAPPPAPEARQLPAGPAGIAGPPAPVAPVPSLPPMPAFGGGESGDLDRDVKHQAEQANFFRAQQADAQAVLDTAQAAHLQQQTADLQQIQADYQAKLKENIARQKLLQSDQIDPMRLMHEMGPFNQTLAVLGLGLGGFGAALAGTPNDAKELLSNAIDRDLRAQQSNMEKNLRLNENDRLRLADEFSQRKADVLDLSGSIMRREGLKQAPAINAAALQVKNATTTVEADKLRSELATQAMNRSVANWNIRQQEYQNKLARAAYEQNQAATREILGSGGDVGGKLALRTIITDPKLSVEHHVSYRGAPELGTDGIPLLKNGQPIYKPTTGRYLQSPQQREKFDSSDVAISGLQDSINEVTRLIRAHPEGIPISALSAEDAKRANQLQQTMTTQIGAVQNLGALSDKDYAIALGQIPQITVYGGLTGATLEALRGIQHYADAQRAANEHRLFPDYTKGR